MKNGFVASLLLVLPGLASPAVAGPFDGSQPLVCAMFEARMCAYGQQCESQTPEAMDAPRFLKVSVADKSITGVRPSGTSVDAKIELVRHSSGAMFLQGAQETFSWNLVIDEADGRMTLALADGEDGAVAFGACTLP